MSDEQHSTAEPKPIIETEVLIFDGRTSALGDGCWGWIMRPAFQDRTERPFGTVEAAISDARAALEPYGLKLVFSANDPARELIHAPTLD